MQLTCPIFSENLMQSRLRELDLQSIDVGGVGDCFFRSLSHQLYGNSNHLIRRTPTAGVQFMREKPGGWGGGLLYETDGDARRLA